MKTYLQRLVARSLPDVAKNTLLPNSRQWSELIDPFENSMIVPLAMPLVKEKFIHDDKQQTLLFENNKSPASQSEKSTKPTRRIGLPKATKLRQILAKEVSHQYFINESVRQHSPNLHISKARGNQLLEKVIETREVHEKSVEYKQAVIRSQRQKIKPRLPIVRRLSTYQERIQQIITENGKPNAGPITYEKGRANQQTISSTPLLPVREKNKVVPEIQRTRKKQNSSQQKPRLVIGHLSVDIVPVAKQKQRMATKSIHKKIRKKASQTNSGQTIKSRFGIGQM